VECVDGSRYRAGKAVVSTIHVKHLVNIAQRELWGEEFTRNLEVFQPEHAMFSFHFATSDPPRYPLPGGGTISTVEVSLMEHPESILLLSSFNARAEVNVEDIPLQIVSPSVGDPSRAPGRDTTPRKIEGTMLCTEGRPPALG
jgi:hypothetical protein